ncbi:hypothetical protein D3C72_1871030 [compost metagenome]
MRIACQGVGRQPDPLDQLRRMLAPRLFAHAAPQGRQPFVQYLSDAHARIQRCVGILENDLNVLTQAL